MQTNAEGYLLNLSDWNESVAIQIAAAENLTLTNDHWCVINFLRDFYHQYKITPAMRVVIKELKDALGEKSNSTYLQQLFPGGFFKQGCKLAGLPKPTRCI